MNPPGGLMLHWSGHVIHETPNLKYMCDISFSKNAPSESKMWLTPFLKAATRGRYVYTLAIQASIRDLYLGFGVWPFH